MKKFILVLTFLLPIGTLALPSTEVETYNLEHGRQYQVDIFDEDHRGEIKTIFLKVPAFERPVCQIINENGIDKVLYIGSVRVKADRKHTLHMLIRSLKSVGACI
jgi:hypothetical protein